MSKKNESKRKIDLKSAILLLLLLAVLLTATTYAWFTANKTVTVTDIDVNIAAQNGLQISANGVDWKSIVTKDDLLTAAYENNTNQIPSIIEPVSTAGDVTGGKMKMFYGELSPSGTTYALTAKEEATEQKGTTGKYVAFDIFLKVNQDEPNVILGANSTVTFKGAEAATNQGLENAARVALLFQGNSPSTDPVTNFVAQNGALSFTTDSQTTTYIWEPNSDVHTAAGVKAAYDTYRITTTETSASPIAYYGVNKAISTPVKLMDTYGTDKTSFTAMTNANLYSTVKGMTDKQNAFSLDEGVTKVTVYMWVEGQDVDCENTASGSEITFRLELKVPENS